MKTYEFWRESETGDVSAVELEEGIVVGCRGPLHWSDVKPLFRRAGYGYSRAEAGALQTRRDESEPLDEATVLTILGSVD